MSKRDFAQMLDFQFDQSAAANGKSYATVSLCNLTVTNRWFDRFILLVIAVNSIFLALDSPSQTIPYQYYADFVFLCIYTMEMILKIIALGFVHLQYSYLRDYWNVLDFCVVIMGWLGKAISAKNVSAIRVIRILRPLRTINSIPGMRELVQSLLVALPDLFDILILLLFFYIMVGAIGVQLFIGQFKYRCYSSTGQIQYDDDGYQTLCLPSSSPTNNFCNDGYTCVEAWNPNYGITSFDNIFKAMFQIFVIMTLEGWTEIMYFVRKTSGTYVYDIYFVFIVLFGTFFILNLMIAVQTDKLNDTIEDYNEKKRQIKEKKQSYKKELKAYKASLIEKQKKDNQNLEELPDQNDESDLSNSDTPQPQKQEDRGKCYKFTQFRERLKAIVESQRFNLFIIIVILINSIFLALVYYDMPQKLNNILYYANVGFTVFFALEMVLKLLGIGFKEYVMDGFNIFDAIIVIIGLLEFLKIKSSFVTVLRVFRLLRIFKILRAWKTLYNLLKVVLKSIVPLSNLLLLMALFCFIYALIGYQFLNGQMKNYYQEQVGWGACAFYVSNLILGNIMLLNMFVAILLNLVLSNLEEEEKQDDPNKRLAEQKNQAVLDQMNYIKDRLKQIDFIDKGSQSNSNFYAERSDIGRDTRTNYRSREAVEEFKSGSIETNNILDNRRGKYNSLQPGNNNCQTLMQTYLLEEGKAEEKQQSEEKTEESVQKIKCGEGKSLFIFRESNKIRRKLKQFMTHSYFEGFIFHLIAFNCLILAFDVPDLKDPYQKKTLVIMNYFLSGIFILEAVIKIIVMGFVLGKNTYLKDGFNILDFFIVACTILSWILDSLSGIKISFVKGFRALRALRPLRVVSKNEGMRNVVNCLITSIPGLLNVLLIALLFYVVFGILFVQLFSGAMSYCNDSSIENKGNCTGSYYDPNQGLFVDREWETYFYAYNNVLQATLTFFELSTDESWPDTLYNTIDSVGEDQAPVTNNRLYITLIFIVYQCITNFFVMNLFDTVVVDKFCEEVKKRDGSHTFTEEQKEWVKIQRIMVTLRPKYLAVQPKHLFRKFCFNLVHKNQKFEFFIMIMIGLNSIILILNYDGASDQYNNILNYLNDFFVGIFTLEMIIKQTAYGFAYYFRKIWNKFDSAIAIISIISLNADFQTLNFTALRIIRVARVFKMIKASKGIKNLLRTLFLALENIVNVAALLLLVIFTFSIAGIAIFGDMEYGDNINANSNYQSFYSAIMLLIKTTTGENWNYYMSDCYDANGIVAVIYWIIFIIIAQFVFLNIFTAVIYESFTEIKSSEDQDEVLTFKTQDFKNFINTWAKFNPEGEYYMKTSRLEGFLLELPPPLGYKGQKMDISRLRKIIFCLNIRDYGGKVYFPEVMWSLFHSILGSSDEKVQKCEQVQNIIKTLKKNYTGLDKKTNAQSICGNKFYKHEMTASKHIAGMKLLQLLRMRVQKQKALRNQSEKIELEKFEDLLKKEDGLLVDRMSTIKLCKPFKLEQEEQNSVINQKQEEKLNESSCENQNIDQSQNNDDENVNDDEESKIDEQINERAENSLDGYSPMSQQQILNDYEKNQSESSKIIEINLTISLKEYNNNNNQGIYEFLTKNNESQMKKP